MNHYINYFQKISVNSGQKTLMIIKINHSISQLKMNLYISLNEEMAAT